MVTYYKVGGCVRDQLLGVKSKDIDYAVVANSYDDMKNDLVTKGTIIYQERPEFFSIRGNHPEYGPVDFTLCRKEGFYSDNRHPDSVEPGTIFDDLARRDFTINAIAIDESGKFIDPHNGRYDLEHNTLQCVGNTKDRLTEDPLRILRAIRFRIVRGFEFELTLDLALRYNPLLNLLKTLPLERVYEELKKCYEYNTWNTMEFFKYHPIVENIIFRDMGLGLEPRIPYIT